MIVLGVTCVIISVFFIYLDNHVIYIPMSFNQGVAAIFFYYIGFLVQSKYKSIIISGISIKLSTLLVCAATILATLPFSGLGMANCAYQCYPLNVICATTITFLCFLLSRKLENVKIISGFLSWCGRNSMLVLCVHTVFLKTSSAYPTIDNPLLCLVFCLAYALVISWALSKMSFVKYIFQIK